MQLAALPTASVPVSNIQCIVQPYVCKDRAIPGDIGLAIDFNMYKYAYRVRQGNL